MTTPEQRREPVVMRADRLKHHFLGMVLPNAGELVAVSGLSPQQVKDDIMDWRKKGYLDSADMSCLLPSSSRMWPTARGLDHLEASEEQRSWLSPAGLTNLMEFNIPKVETLNDLVRRWPHPGWSLSGVHIYKGSFFLAVAEYHRPGDSPAYAAFVWASMMDTERDLFHRLEAVPEALQAQTQDPDTLIRPSKICIVSSDAWSATRALKLAQSLGPDWFRPTYTTAWYYGKDGWIYSDVLSVLTGRPPGERHALHSSIGSLRPSTSTRKQSWRLDRIVARSIWSGRGGQRLVQLLTMVGQFSVGALDHYKVLVGEARNSTRTRDRMNKLMAMGLVRVVVERGRASDVTLRKIISGEEIEFVAEKSHDSGKPLRKRRQSRKRDRFRRRNRGVPVAISSRGQGKKRFALTKKGRVRFCRIHGGRLEHLATRTNIDNSEPGKWNIRHQDCVLEFLVQCYEMGCPIVPEWRATITLANGIRLKPDGAVLAHTPTWGRTWCNVEVEYSDRTPKAIRKRCRRYASPNRLDDYPLLVVAYNERAETNFHLVGKRYGLRMLTTTMRRLAESGVAGEGVWSHYGAPVTLSA